MTSLEQGANICKKFWESYFSVHFFSVTPRPEAREKQNMPWAGKIKSFLDKFLELTKLKICDEVNINFTLLPGV